MMRPLGRRVVLKRSIATEEKRGSIWIPDRARSFPQEGEVIAIGPEVTTVQVGDRVLFGKFSVLEIEAHGTIIWEKDIMGVLE